MRYCAIVSAVPPDFDVTTNSVRSSGEAVEQRTRSCAGSTLSRTCSRGWPPRSSFVERVPRGLEQRRAQRDRAERRTADPEHDDVVELAARFRREIGRLVVQRVVGRQREESELARVATALESRVRARETPSAADVQSAAAMPPSTTSPIMLV